MGSACCAASAASDAAYPADIDMVLVAITPAMINEIATPHPPPPPSVEHLHAAESGNGASAVVSCSSKTSHTTQQDSLSRQTLSNNVNSVPRPRRVHQQSQSPNPPTEQSEGPISRDPVVPFDQADASSSWSVQGALQTPNWTHPVHDTHRDGRNDSRHRPPQSLQRGSATSVCVSVNSSASRTAPQRRTGLAKGTPVGSSFTSIAVRGSSTSTTALEGGSRKSANAQRPGPPTIVDDSYPPIIDLGLGAVRGSTATRSGTAEISETDRFLHSSSSESDEEEAQGLTVAPVPPNSTNTSVTMTHGVATSGTAPRRPSDPHQDSSHPGQKRLSFDDEGNPFVAMKGGESPSNFAVNPITSALTSPTNPLLPAAGVSSGNLSSGGVVSPWITRPQNGFYDSLFSVLSTAKTHSTPATSDVMPNSIQNHHPHTSLTSTSLVCMQSTQQQQHASPVRLQTANTTGTSSSSSSSAAVQGGSSHHTLSQSARAALAACESGSTYTLAATTTATTLSNATWTSRSSLLPPPSVASTRAGSAHELLARGADPQAAEAERMAPRVPSFGAKA